MCLGIGVEAVDEAVAINKAIVKLCTAARITQDKFNDLLKDVNNILVRAGVSAHLIDICRKDTVFKVNLEDASSSLEKVDIIRGFAAEYFSNFFDKGMMDIVNAPWRPDEDPQRLVVLPKCRVPPKRKSSSMPKKKVVNKKTTVVSKKATKRKAANDGKPSPKKKFAGSSTTPGSASQPIVIDDSEDDENNNSKFEDGDNDVFMEESTVTTTLQNINVSTSSSTAILPATNVPLSVSSSSSDTHISSSVSSNSSSISPLQHINNDPKVLHQELEEELDDCDKDEEVKLHHKVQLMAPYFDICKIRKNDRKKWKSAFRMVPSDMLKLWLLQLDASSPCVPPPESWKKYKTRTKNEQFKVFKRLIQLRHFVNIRRKIINVRQTCNQEECFNLFHYTSDSAIFVSSASSATDDKSSLSIEVESLSTKNETMEELEAGGYKRRNVGGHGNCMYQSVSVGLIGDESLHPKLRKDSMDLMENHSTHFEIQIRGVLNQSVEQHVADHRILGKDADNYDIEALATSIQRHIIIYQYNKKATIIRPFVDLNDVTVEEEPIMIFYNGVNHYEAIIRSDEPQTYFQNEDDVFDAGFDNDCDDDNMDVVNTVTPKKTVCQSRSTLTCSSTSSKFLTPTRLKKVVPLEFYFDECKMDKAEKLTMAKTLKDIPHIIIGLISNGKSEDDPCVPTPSDGRKLSKYTKEFRKQTLNYLVKRRFLESAPAEVNRLPVQRHISQMCKTPNCLNLYHYKYQEIKPVNQMEPSIILANYSFEQRTGDNAIDWCCCDCKLLNRILYYHKWLIHGRSFKSETMGSIQKLPNGTFHGSPESPGGHPHICRRKKEILDLVARQKAENGIATQKENIKRKIQEFQQWRSGLIRTIDPKSLTKTLRFFFGEMKDTFKFNKKHKKYFVYFFTLSGEKDILYYGITHEPASRIRDHETNKDSPMYKYFQTGKELIMHLMPLGDINVMFAAELETLLIRMSKNGHLNDGPTAIGNEDGGRFSSIPSFYEDCINAGDGKRFDNLKESLNELIESSFKCGSTLSSFTQTNSFHNSFRSFKNILAKHFKQYQKLNVSVEDDISSSCADDNLSDTMPQELEAFLDNLKTIFFFDKYHRKCYVYFFTYAGKKDIIYYGITWNPKERFHGHKLRGLSPLATLFEAGHKLEMHVLPLGDINYMLATELEAMFIRMSKENKLEDGESEIFNSDNGRFSSEYEVHQIFTDDPTYEEERNRMKLALNQLVELTFKTGEIISNA